MWVTITEPMELESDKSYYGVHYLEDGRTWLFGEGVEGLNEAQTVAAQAREREVEARVVMVFVEVTPL